MSHPNWNKKIDDKLQEAFKDENINIPEKAEIWLNVQEELEREHRKKQRKKRWKTYGGVAIAAALFISLLSSPVGSSAFTNFFKMVEEWRDDVIELIIRPSEEQNSDGEALTIPPPNEEEPIENRSEAAPQSHDAEHSKEVTLEEAHELMAFPLSELSKAVIDDYELIRVEVTANPENEVYYKVEETYRNEANWFSISQEKLSESTNRTMKYDTETTEVKSIQIGHYEGHFILFPEYGTLRLEWVMHDISLMIHGNISENTAIDIASSMVHP